MRRATDVKFRPAIGARDRFPLLKLEVVESPERHNLLSLSEEVEATYKYTDLGGDIVSGAERGKILGEATTLTRLGKAIFLTFENMRYIPSLCGILSLRSPVADNTKRTELTRHLSAGILGNPQAVEDTCPSARKRMLNALVKRVPSLLMQI